MGKEEVNEQGKQGGEETKVASQKKEIQNKMVMMELDIRGIKIGGSKLGESSDTMVSNGGGGKLGIECQVS